MMGRGVWRNDCNATVTVKWCDDDICAEGCVATLVDEATPFYARTGTTEYAVCWGEAEPLRFDGLGDTDWTCPEAAAA